MNMMFKLRLFFSIGSLIECLGVYLRAWRKRGVFSRFIKRSFLVYSDHMATVRKKFMIPLEIMKSSITGTLNTLQKLNK